MVEVFRVKTVYHLLQVLLLINNRKNESYKILFLDDKSLFKYKLILEQLKYFDEVKYVTYLLNNKSIDLIFHFLFYKVLVFYTFFAKPLKSMSDVYLYTSCHNIPFDMRYFLVNHKLVILEEGNYSYRIELDSSINPFYDDVTFLSLFKQFFANKFFIRFTNPNITRVLFWSLKKFNNSPIPVFLSNKKYFIDVKDMKFEVSLINNSELNNILSIFGANLNIKKNSLIILTQPIKGSGRLKFPTYIEKIKNTLHSFSDIDNFYIKVHPRDDLSNYADLVEEFKINVIYTDLPFELFGELGFSFLYGVTYDSTSIDVDFIEKKIILNPDYLLS